MRDGEGEKKIVPRAAILGAFWCCTQQNFLTFWLGHSGSPDLIQRGGRVARRLYPPPRVFKMAVVEDALFCIFCGVVTL